MLTHGLCLIVLLADPEVSNGGSCSLCFAAVIVVVSCAGACKLFIFPLSRAARWVLILNWIVAPAERDKLTSEFHSGVRGFRDWRSSVTSL